MNMKHIKSLALAGLLGCTMYVSAAGTISSPGWYYQALPVGALGTYENIFLKGPYADEASCDVARWDEYDPSNGILPWDGGPGCHYIYENSIDQVNELYSVAFNPGTDVILVLDAAAQQLYLEEVEQINQQHDIKNYKMKINQLLNKYRKAPPRR